jgi:hypothetical protein
MQYLQNPVAKLAYIIVHKSEIYVGFHFSLSTEDYTKFSDTKYQEA